MIRRDGEEANEITVPMGSGPTCPTDAQGVNGIKSWRRLDAADLLPLEILVAIELIPGELANLVEGGHRCMPLGILQHQQMLLKYGVIEIQANRCFIIRHN